MEDASCSHNQFYSAEYCVTLDICHWQGWRSEGKRKRMIWEDRTGLDSGWRLLPFSSLFVHVRIGAFLYVATMKRRDLIMQTVSVKREYQMMQEPDDGGAPHDIGGAERRLVEDCPRGKRKWMPQPRSCIFPSHGWRWLAWSGGTYLSPYAPRLERFLGLLPWVWWAPMMSWMSFILVKGCIEREDDNSSHLAAKPSQRCVDAQCIWDDPLVVCGVAACEVNPVDVLAYWRKGWRWQYV